MATGLNHGCKLTQTNGLISASIPDVRGAQLGAVYHGQRKSGEFYDFVRVNNARVLFGLFDVAGTLLVAHSVAKELQHAFRVVGAELLGSSSINEIEALCELFIRLNSTIMKVARGVHFCPAFFGCYNEDLHAVSFVNAGHTAGLCRHHEAIRPLEPTALPLGLFSHAVPDSSVVCLSPGDGILLLSKGIVEARRRNEEFGSERARDYFLDARFQSAHESCVGILERVRQFATRMPTHHDVTAVCLLRSAQLPE